MLCRCTRLRGGLSIFIPSPLFQLRARDDSLRVRRLHKLAQLKHADELGDFPRLWVHKFRGFPKVIAVLRRQPLGTRVAEKASGVLGLGVTGKTETHTDHMM